MTAVISKESLAAKIREVEKERDIYLAQANQQVAAFNGAIQVLQSLVDPPKPETKDDKKKD